MPILYSAPTPAQLALFKQELGLSSTQMAELFGISEGRQWRKYTGGDRDISLQMLFFGLARLELDEATIERIFDRMRKVGAIVDVESTA
ncbi:XRE family transcriptional regulator [Cupriavidus gilardii]|uniref:XRE family transcriptional regulator n=2 Tax=Cupriavidus gilardii TaxID=82541 RepID=A0A849BHM3_9BURK|nr:XRE family transcriptional regulator [Cupriavidus gilardii]KAB0593771.1 XRE family transcriptional regulator [Cupriavidus gilardii]NNH13816.1 XRE family transcriptional regulator [Cupriavidus gilardii]